MDRPSQASLERMLFGNIDSVPASSAKYQMVDMGVLLRSLSVVRAGEHTAAVQDAAAACLDEYRRAVAHFVNNAQTAVRHQVPPLRYLNFFGGFRTQLVLRVSYSVFCGKLGCPRF